MFQSHNNNSLQSTTSLRSSSKLEKPITTMYPPSSTPQKPNTVPSSAGLTRFCSAPGSFLTRAVDSVIGNSSDRDFSAFGSPSQHRQQQQHQYSFSATHDSTTSSLTSESTCKASSSRSSGLQRSYGFNEIGNTGSLLRQKSSPAGFLSNHLSTENGFSITQGGHAVSRLKSQLSFTRQDSLSQISEVSEDAVEGISTTNGHQNSYPGTGFGMGSWDGSNSIVFSGPPNKRMKNIDGDIFNYGLETQFSLPQTSLEMATVEKLLNIPEDSVPCKIRAKRGCATHPRSIAERERRTRISGRLKKLQDLVPNMDKQTSYADMLDLAVQHIKGLQGEVQKLHKELENCTCGCKPST